VKSSGKARTAIIGSRWPLDAAIGKIGVLEDENKTDKRNKEDDNQKPQKLRRSTREKKKTVRVRFAA